MPFLENVTRGRNIPYERLLEVPATIIISGDEALLMTNAGNWSGPRKELQSRARTAGLLGQSQLASLAAGHFASMRDDGVQEGLRFCDFAHIALIPGAASISENVRAAQLAVGEDGAPKSIKSALSIIIRISSRLPPID